MTLTDIKVGDIIQSVADNQYKVLTLHESNGRPTRLELVNESDDFAVGHVFEQEIGYLMNSYTMVRRAPVVLEKKTLLAKMYEDF